MNGDEKRTRTEAVLHSTGGLGASMLEGPFGPDKGKGGKSSISSSRFGCPGKLTEKSMLSIHDVAREYRNLILYGR